MKIVANVKNANAQQLFQDCAALAEQRGETLGEYLQPRFSHLTKRAENLTEAMKSARSVVGLEEKDEMRDAALKTLIVGVKGYTALPFPEKQAAAQVLLEVIERHGGLSIVNLPYKEESGILDSVEHEFSSAENAARIKLLDGVGELSSALWAANAAVKTLNLQNTQSKAADGASAYEIKKELILYFNTQIEPYLLLMQNDEHLGSFASEIFAAVAKANATAPKKAKK